MTNERYEEWTSCEMYGHLFAEGSCVDCQVREGDSTMMTVADAHKFAQTAHAGQKYGEVDYYTEHLAVVAALLTPFGPELEIAGVLHDVVEDTDTTFADLANLGVPLRAIRAIEGVTRWSRETYADFIARAALHPDSALVKWADNKANRDALDLLPPDHPKRGLARRYEKSRQVLDTALDGYFETAAWHSHPLWSQIAAE